MRGHRIVMGAIVALIALHVAVDLANGMPLDRAVARSEKAIELLTGRDIATRPVTIGGVEEMRTCGFRPNPPKRGCAGLAWADRIHLSRAAVANITNFDPRRREDPETGKGWHTLLHEMLHDGYHRGGRNEEAATDLMTNLLYYRWHKIVTGYYPYWTYLSYPSYVRWLRTVSIKKTGAQSDVDDRAVEWAVEFYFASDTRREEMLK